MEEATEGTERVEATAETDTITGHRRSAAGQEDANESPKRPHDDEEEEQMLANLARFRRQWPYGPIDRRSEVGPMRFTKEPEPRYSDLDDALQIFSIKVTKLNGIMCWPIDVFGLIAVRNSVDRNRTYMFELTREDCQTLTAEDSSLILTGPSCAVLLYDPIAFEIELRVKGTRPSEDKILIGEAFEYNCITQVSRADSLQNKMVSGPRSTLEFKYAHLSLALEATIKAWISEGTSDFCGMFAAHTASIDESVTLLDSRDKMVSVSGDGPINFSRGVVVVEGEQGKLVVGVEATQRGDEESSSVCKEVTFTPATSGESRDMFDVGLCKMSVVVAWSMLSVFI